MITSQHTETNTNAIATPAWHEVEIANAVQRIHHPLSVVQEAATLRQGLVVEDLHRDLPAGVDRLWRLPALKPEHLGDPGFRRAHGVRFPYIAGEMANGIATAETGAEDAVVDLLLRHQVRRVCASAYLQLTPAVVRYACSGLALDREGLIVRPHKVMAKLSRPEIARRFAAPAPAAMLAALVERGQLTAREAELATQVPLVQDITVEADSGGHTDNRPLVALFPTIAQAVRETQIQHGHTTPIRVGAAGGLGTPQSIAAAFSLGAAYVVTGSINQAAVESGLSPAGRALLAQASMEDVAMAPASDMFELGVKVQVLKRGTMFCVRAQRLYEAYRKYPSLDDIPEPERRRLEAEIFKAPLEAIWRETQAFFAQRNPGEVERADREPKHRMALVFRWYLGQASRWAIQGVADRVLDYQIWCGPAMGAFNAWTQGSFLADPKERTVVQIARNLMEGAATVTRAHQLRSLGMPVPADAFEFRPRRLG